VWSTYVASWEYLWAFLSYRLLPVPVWLLLVIGAAAYWGFRKLMLASEAREDKRDEVQTERDELAQELAQITQAEAAEQMEGPAPIQEAVIDGLLWRCTYGPDDKVASAGAFCPICDSEIDPSRRHALVGSPAQYTCPRGDAPTVRFNKAASQVTRDIGLEINRRNRADRRRFRDLIKEKMAAGLDPVTARAAALNQTLHDRQQHGTTGLIY